MAYPNGNFMRNASPLPLFSTFAVAVIALASPMFSQSARANLVTNGGFEDNPTVIVPGALGTAVGGAGTDWIDGDLNTWDTGPSVGGGLNVIATNQDVYYGGTPSGGPHSGDLAAVFPNFPNYNGYISQAVAGVVAGSIYKISFWLANQIGDTANNYMSVNWGGTIASPGDSITGGYSLSGGGGSPALPNAIPVHAGWTYYEFSTVGAPSSNARLSFIGGNAAAGNLIDDVSVEFVAVPEVSSFGTVMGLGLLALGTAARIRRRSLATA